MGQHLHKLSKIDEGLRTATCAWCGPNTPLKSAGRQGWRCKTAYYEMPCNQGDGASRTNGLRRQDLLAAQGGVCALCGSESNRWCLDHDHANGMIRGVLCYSCNVGLGQFGDDADRLMQAIDYLDLWSRKHELDEYPQYRKH